VCWSLYFELFSNINKQKMARTVITTTDAPAPVGPYNQAILVNGTLYVSGQVALVDGKVLEGSIEDETHAVMKNLGAVLKAANMDYSNIAKCSIFVKDMDNFGRINEVYGSYFGEDAPARETVEVSRLPKDVNVEISCIAIQQ
jgi:2-iminobutanoate/2-iminopropanoate deaminase